MVQKSITPILFLIFVVFSTLPSVSASPENISILSPANDNPVYGADFPVQVYVNDTNVRYVQVRTAGASWRDLEQVTSTEWTGTFQISNYPNGNYVLTAKYLRNGETAWSYVASTTTFTISRPDVTLEISVKDDQNSSLQGVVISPGGNLSDSAGKITIRGLTLNSVYNFVLNKTGYFDTSFQYIPSAYAGYQTKTLTRRSSTALKKLKITGMSSFAEVNTMFNLRVRDAETDVPIYGAQVKLYEGLQVISIPGTTSSTGRITASFNSPGEFELVVEMDGYEEYSEMVTVIAPRTSSTPTPTPTPSPTPAPTPTPVPTVQKTFRPDIGAEVTDDQYREWLALQEKKQINATIPPPPIAQPTQTPAPEPTIPSWGLFAVGGLLVGAYLVKRTLEKNGNGTSKIPKKDILDSSNEHSSVVNILGKKDRMVTIKCEKCEWTKDVPAAFSENDRQALVDAHFVSEHKE